MASTTRIPTRQVRTGGALSYLSAVTLTTITAPRPLTCGGCLVALPEGAPVLRSRRAGDTAGSFDVHYCGTACRTRFVGAGL